MIGDYFIQYINKLCSNFNSHSFWHTSIGAKFPFVSRHKWQTKCNRFKRRSILPIQYMPFAINRYVKYKIIVSAIVCSCVWKSRICVDLRSINSKRTMNIIWLFSVEFDKMHKWPIQFPFMFSVCVCAVCVRNRFHFHLNWWTEMHFILWVAPKINARATGNGRQPFSFSNKQHRTMATMHSVVSP